MRWAVNVGPFSSLYIPLIKGLLHCIGASSRKTLHSLGSHLIFCAKRQVQKKVNFVSASKPMLGLGWAAWGGTNNQPGCFYCPFAGHVN